MKKFQKAGREDLINQAKNELAIVEKYMPKQLSKDEVTKIVKEVIDELNASQYEELWTSNGAVMPKVQDKQMEN